jgi:hypothetical protein
MADSSDIWSKRRQARAQHVAAILYGVIAVMTAELAVEPGEFGYAEAALGVLLVGLAMAVTRIFVEVVKKETELGAHLPIRKAGTIIVESLLVLVFPAVTAVLIVIAALTTVQWARLLNLVLYLGIAAVFTAGFLSSYVLDRKIRPALLRGLTWLVLSVILAVAKSLA